MKILFIGYFDSNYNRTAILSDGLKELGHRVNYRIFKHKRERISKNEWQKLNLENDIFFIPSFSHFNVPYIKKNATIPVVFDPLISKYQTRVEDYKVVSRYSIAAYKAKIRDKRAFEAADLIISDTKANMDYFSTKYHISIEKFILVPIGIRKSELKHSKSFQNKKIIIGFYGGFNPLQGTDIIAESISHLDNENIEFRIIGDGFCFKSFKQKIENLKLQNVTLMGRLSYDKLLEETEKFDICLGIFGDTSKSELVIPNKIFHYAGLSKCIITKKSQAIAEIFKDDFDIVLCNDDSKDLAAKISYICNNIEKAKTIGKNAFNIVSEKYISTMLAKNMVDSIDKKLN